MEGTSTRSGLVSNMKECAAWGAAAAGFVVLAAESAGGTRYLLEGEWRMFHENGQDLFDYFCSSELLRETPMCIDKFVEHSIWIPAAMVGGAAVGAVAGAAGYLFS